MPRKLPKNSSWVQLTKDFVKEWPEILEGLDFTNMPVKYLLYCNINLKNNITIHYVVGNHDYWVQDFITEVLFDKTYFSDTSFNSNGKKFYVTHGDGYLSWDRGYRLLRAIIRSRLFIWLYRWVHPNIGYAFGRWVSKNN